MMCGMMSDVNNCVGTLPRENGPYIYGNNRKTLIGAAKGWPRPFHGAGRFNMGSI